MTRTLPRPGVALEALLADFGTYQRRRNLSPGTIRTRAFKITWLDQWCRARHNTDALNVTTELLEQWLDEADVQPQTRYTYISQLTAFYRWAVNAGHLIADPTSAIERPRLPKWLPRPIATEGLEEAIRYADARMRAWLCLGAYQGFRCVELARLRGEDVDVSRMTITAHGKGNKDRTIALHPKTLAALRSYGLPSRGIVFLKRGSATVGLKPSSISQYISEYLAEIGSAHQLRHWFGTEVYDSSKDLLLTQQLLGHASPATTAIYAQVNGERGRGVIGQLGETFPSN